MNYNNNIRITRDNNGYYKIKLAKLRLVKFKTSKKNKELLLKGSNPADNSVKINHVVKHVNGRYYTVFNIE